MEISLEQLKAENAAEEARLLAATASGEDEQEADAAEVEGEPTETDADQSEGEAETEVESWMKEDDQTSEDGGEVIPLAAHVKTRTKLKGQIREKDSEIEQLRQQIEQLKQGVTQAPAPTVVKAPPRLEDYDYDEAKYAEAQAKYVSELVSQTLSTHTQKSETERAQKEAKRKIEESLSGHYERAEKLIGSGITAEQYQAADTRLRQAIEQVRPGQGDAVTDFLLANLGEGSEKVGYHLGVNNAARAELQSKLLADPTGISAAVWLGTKLKELSPPKQLRSNAPKPATKLQSDESIADSLRSLRADVAKARKAGDMQKVIDLKFAAKAKGIDVSNL